MRIIVRPVVDPEREIDLTNRLVSAIAEELWRRYGGNDQLNWLEAERHLERIVSEAQAEARETGAIDAADAAARHARDGAPRPELSSLALRAGVARRRGAVGGARDAMKGKRPMGRAGAAATAAAC